MIFILIVTLALLISYAILKFKGSIGLLLLFPFILHLVLNMMGVFNLYFFTNMTTVGIRVSDNIRNMVSMEFFISYIFIIISFYFTMFVLGKFKFQDDIVSYYSSLRAKLVNKRLVIVTVVLLTFDAFFYGIPPGFYALAGDVSGAAIQKGAFLEAKINGAVPLIGYYVRYIPLIAFVHVMLFFLIKNDGKKYFYIICSVFLLYSLLTLIKSYLFLPLMLYLWALFVFGKLKIVSVLKMSVILIPVLYVTFSGLYNDSSVIFYKIFERVFLVQAEGMYLIRDYYDSFELGALLYSSPFRHFVGIEVFDPAAEIVKHYFGEGSGWVNMNSFFTGQAYLMFGRSYMIIIPIIFIIQFLISRATLKLSLNNGLANVTLIGICLFLPLSNNIANLVWFKDYIASIIILPLLYFIFKIKKV